MLMELPKTPIVEVHTTNNRGFTPEEVATRCVDRIISIGDKAPPEIQEQARAFRDGLEKTITFFMKEAIISDRTTIYNAIKDAGYEKLAEQIRRM